MLKLVTYNIECGLQDEQLRKNIKSFKDQGINVFCLQEVRKLQNEPFIGDKFLRDLGPKWKSEYFLVPEFGGIGLALCIIWNSDILNLAGADKIPLPEFLSLNFWERAFIKAVLGHVQKNNWFALFGSQVNPIMLKRGALVCDFDLGSSKLRILTAHLDWAGGLRQRLSQIKYITDYLSTRPKVEREIVCGDFNTLGMFFSFKKRSEQVRKFLPADFYDTLAEPKTTARLFQRLDYIFQKGFKKFDAKVMPVKGSDHKPIIATLEL